MLKVKKAENGYIVTMLDKFDYVFTDRIDMIKYVVDNLDEYEQVIVEVKVDLEKRIETISI